MKKIVTIAAVAAFATLAACSKPEAPVDVNATEAATDAAIATATDAANATEAAPATLGGGKPAEGGKEQEK